MGRKSYSPEDKKINLTIRIDPQAKRELEVLKTKVGKTVSTLCQEGIESLIKRYQDEGVYTEVVHEERMREKMLESDGKNHKGVSILFANNKGGVGKTTVTTSLAVLAAKEGYRVLVIDLDGQMNLSNRFGYDHSNNDTSITNYIKSCIDEVMQNKKASDRTYPSAENYICPTHIKNLDIIPSDLWLGDDILGTDTLRANSKFMNSTVMDKILDKIRELNLYDLILIDSSPSFSEIITSTVRASDWVVIPTDVDTDGFKGVDELVDYINGFEEGMKVAKIAGVLFNRANSTRGLTKSIPGLKNAFKEKGISCFDTVIPETAIVSNTKAEGRIAVEARPNDKLTKKYTELLRELVKTIGY